jgi:hypothetical protein
VGSDNRESYGIIKEGIKKAKYEADQIIQKRPNMKITEFKIQRPLRTPTTMPPPSVHSLSTSATIVWLQLSAAIAVAAYQDTLSD